MPRARDGDEVEVNTLDAAETEGEVGQCGEEALVGAVPVEDVLVDAGETWRIAVLAAAMRWERVAEEVEGDEAEDEAAGVRELKLPLEDIAHRGHSLLQRNLTLVLFSRCVRVIFFLAVQCLG
jgi:hypothetical protein